MLASILATFWKPEGFSQTVLPDRLILIGQKCVENAKIEKFKCDIMGDFQTLCASLGIQKGKTFVNPNWLRWNDRQSRKISQVRNVFKV